MLLAALLVAAGPMSPCPAETITPIREYSGIYLDDFEGQRFFEGAKDLAQVNRRDADRVWIDLDVVGLGKRFGIERRTQWTAYLITFNGLKRSRDGNTSFPCGYGHMGGSGAQISVERLLSIKSLGSFQSSSDNPR